MSRESYLNEAASHLSNIDACLAIERAKGEVLANALAAVDFFRITTGPLVAICGDISKVAGPFKEIVKYLTVLSGSLLLFVNKQEADLRLRAQGALKELKGIIK